MIKSAQHARPFLTALQSVNEPILPSIVFNATSRDLTFARFVAHRSFNIIGHTRKGTLFVSDSRQSCFRECGSLACLNFYSASNNVAKCSHCKESFCKQCMDPILRCICLQCANSLSENRFIRCVCIAKKKRILGCGMFFEAHLLQ